VRDELQNQIVTLADSEETVKEATRLLIENVEGLSELPSKVQYGNTKIFIKVRYIETFVIFFYFLILILVGWYACTHGRDPV